MRFRYQINTRHGTDVQHTLAEDCAAYGFVGAPSDAEWLESGDVEQFLQLQPSANIEPDMQRAHLERLIEQLPKVFPHLESQASNRAEELRDAHRRVRAIPGAKGARYEVEPKLPVDILGVYIYLGANK